MTVSQTKTALNLPASPIPRMSSKDRTLNSVLPTPTENEASHRSLHSPLPGPGTLPPGPLSLQTPHSRRFPSWEQNDSPKSPYETTAFFSRRGLGRTAGAWPYEPPWGQAVVAFYFAQTSFLFPQRLHTLHLLRTRGTLPSPTPWGAARSPDSPWTSGSPHAPRGRGHPPQRPAGPYPPPGPGRWPGPPLLPGSSSRVSSHCARQGRPSAPRSRRGAPRASEAGEAGGPGPHSPLSPGGGGAAAAAPRAAPLLPPPGHRRRRRSASGLVPAGPRPVRFTSSPARAAGAWSPALTRKQPSRPNNNT